MKDRIPTQVLENGAVRMETFNELGESQGYIWLKRADEPTENGTPMNKSTFLKDTTSQKYGLDPETSVPDDVFNYLSGSYYKEIGYAKVENLGYRESCSIEIEEPIINYKNIIIFMSNIVFSIDVTTTVNSIYIYPFGKRLTVYDGSTSSSALEDSFAEINIAYKDDEKLYMYINNVSYGERAQDFTSVSLVDNTQLDKYIDLENKLLSSSNSSSFEIRIYGSKL